MIFKVFVVRVFHHGIEVGGMTLVCVAIAQQPNKAVKVIDAPAIRNWCRLEIRLHNAEQPLAQLWGIIHDRVHGPFLGGCKRECQNPLFL